MQADIRDLFSKRSLDRKQDASSKCSASNSRQTVAERSQIIQDSDDDEVSVAPVAPVQSLKTEPVEPAAFFATSGIKQKTNTNIKVIAKKQEDFDDEFDDGLDDDLVRVLEEQERLIANVTEEHCGVLTTKNTETPDRKRKPPAAPLKDSENAVHAADLVEPTEPQPKKRSTPARKTATPSKKATPVKKEATPVKKVVPAKKEATPKAPVDAPTKEPEPVATAEPTDKKKSGFQKFLAKKTASENMVRVYRPPPVGAPDCLLGMSFVFTGELLSMDRTEAQDLVKRYGGKTPSAVSKKTTYCVVGQEPGESKLNKARGLGTKLIDEDAFYELVNSFGPKADEPVVESSANNAAALDKQPVEVQATAVSVSVAKGKGVAIASAAIKSVSKPSVSTFSLDVPKPLASSQLWTDKYRPSSYDELIGNPGLVKNLASWLRNWSSNKAKGFPKGGKDDPSTGFRAALLSGPPGIGKTTAAHLVANIEGFEAIEFNASDTRSKKALESIVKEATLSRTVTEMFSAKKTPSRKVIIMDEVDGMSAGDRGGSAELIQLIKKTAVPIICICNDHSSPKMKSLAGHCYDLKFRRASAVQVEKRLLTIAAKEKLTLQSNVVGELVAATTGDIRQMLNLLSTFRLGSNNLSYDQTKHLAATASKNINLTPFDVISKLLSQSSFRSSSFADKTDLYFQDYSLIPLFVQARRTLLTAADAISDGDLLEASQRNENSWSLLPLHAVFSTIRPCFFMHGNLVSTGYGMGYTFPAWLGQNSKQTKTRRLLRELQTHMRLLTSADKDQLLLNYLPLLATVLTDPLVKKDIEGVEEVIHRMDHYYLNRDDWDSIMEFGYQKLAAGISTKAKTTFTRTYNKTSHPSPFTGETKKAASTKLAELPDCEDVLLDDVIEEDEAEEEETIEEVKPKGKKTAAKPKASASKGKGRAK
ncbi:hypothetical protein HDU91_005634 [Kappamyces sp. JEL0680]|nr:hypothetical protein HDU91_005634 [Kappamyces sp. JEL0680]